MVVNAREEIKAIEDRYLRKGSSEFDVGDTVRMRIRVQEADKMRLHPFEGTVIRKTGKGIRGTFTVRKISFGEGVERIFPINSPVIDTLVVVNKGVAKRAKLYYLRDRTGKKARVQKDVEKTASPQLATVA